jgi:hypothetical protein
VFEYREDILKQNSLDPFNSVLIYEPRLRLLVDPLQRVGFLLLSQNRIDLAPGGESIRVPQVCRTKHRRSSHWLSAKV